VYVAIAGSADISRDPQLIRHLWSPTHRAWFPEGRDDREATVIRLVIDRIDYWEPPSNQAVRLVQAVKALLTRRPVDTPMKTLDHL
jgi:general stress protein 26